MDYVSMCACSFISQKKRMQRIQLHLLSIQNGSNPDNQDEVRKSHFESERRQTPSPFSVEHDSRDAKAAGCIAMLELTWDRGIKKRNQTERPWIVWESTTTKEWMMRIRVETWENRRCVVSSNGTWWRCWLAKKMLGWRFASVTEFPRVASNHILNLGQGPDPWKTVHQPKPNLFPLLFIRRETDFTPCRRTSTILRFYKCTFKQTEQSEDDGEDDTTF